MKVTLKHSVYLGKGAEAKLVPAGTEADVNKALAVELEAAGAIDPLGKKPEAAEPAPPPPPPPPPGGDGGDPPPPPQ